MNYSIGEICFAVDDTLAAKQHPHVQSFISSHPPHVHCTVTDGEALPGDCLYHSGVTWQLCKMENDLALCMHRGISEEIYQILRLNADYTRAQFYTSKDAPFDSARNFSIDGALFQLWANFLLMQSRGVLLHALGVKIDGLTHLFVGKSAAGKSTLGHLFADAGVGTILSDDRIIVRTDSEELMAHGTPWNGEVPFHSTQAAPLSAIYFLEQSPSCMLEPMHAAEAAARLFSASSVAGWPADAAVRFVLDTTAHIATTTPCYRFGFTPDRRALQMMEWV